MYREFSNINNSDQDFDIFIKKKYNISKYLDSTIRIVDILTIRNGDAIDNSTKSGYTAINIRSVATSTFFLQCIRITLKQIFHSFLSSLAALHIPTPNSGISDDTDSMYSLGIITLGAGVGNYLKSR